MVGISDVILTQDEKCVQIDPLNECMAWHGGATGPIQFCPPKNKTETETAISQSGDQRAPIFHVEYYAAHMNILCTVYGMVQYSKYGEVGSKRRQTAQAVEE